MIVKKRLTVIQVLLILIFVGCCGYLGKYFYDSHKAESGFDELKKVVEKTERADATGGYIDKRADNGMLECYYSLYQQNNDKIADILTRYADTIRSEVLADDIRVGEMGGYTKEWNINGETGILGVEKIAAN